MTGSSQFSARVESDPRRVVVEGELDLASSEQLSSLLRTELEGEDGQEVRLEFGGVTFMDSSGLAALLEVVEAGHQLVLCGAGEPVRRVIEATGLEGVIRVEP